MNQSDGYQKRYGDQEQPAPRASVYAPGVEVVHGIPRGERLPCCGLGIGWTLFILGLFLGIPWYIGAVYLIFVIRKKDYKERPGCFACLIGAVLFTIFIILEVAGVFRFTNYDSNPQ